MTHAGDQSLHRDPAGSSMPSEPVGRWTVEPDAAALGALRAEVSSLAGPWGLSEDDLDVLLLIVSELVSNAVEHARTTSVVIVRRLASLVRVIVIDGSSSPPSLQPYDVTAPRGRGLQMVDKLAARWGWEWHRDGKTVWATMNLTGASPLP